MCLTLTILNSEIKSLALIVFFLMTVQLSKSQRFLYTSVVKQRTTGAAHLSKPAIHHQDKNANKFKPRLISSAQIWIAWFEAEPFLLPGLLPYRLFWSQEKTAGREKHWTKTRVYSAPFCFLGHTNQNASFQASWVIWIKNSQMSLKTFKPAKFKPL